MSIAGNPFPNPSEIKCQRCGASPAVYDVRDDEVEPAVRLLLCQPCNDTYVGRKFVESLRPYITPPLPDQMTDEEVRKYFRGFMDDPRNWERKTGES